MEEIFLLGGLWRGGSLGRREILGLSSRVQMWLHMGWVEKYPPHLSLRTLRRFLLGNLGLEATCGHKCE